MPALEIRREPDNTRLSDIAEQARDHRRKLGFIPDTFHLSDTVAKRLTARGSVMGTKGAIAPLRGSEVLCSIIPAKPLRAVRRVEDTATSAMSSRPLTRLAYGS